MTPQHSRTHGPGSGKRALVTGATAGIGRAFADELAREGWELVLVARDAERLRLLTQELPVPATPLPADLATATGVAVVEDRLADPAAPIDLLVNNAGMSLNTPFLKSTLEQEQYLLALNVQAVLRLTHAAVRAMVERGRGDVINVSSVAGFAATMPGSTYPASKAWVTNFSESVALSVARRGVRVMALCPGFTRTEFHDRGGIDMSKTPRWLWLQAPDVVQIALRDLRRGRLVSVPDWRYKALVGVMRHTPMRMLRKLARRARVRTGRDTE